jgi:hypothetical protein
LQKKIKVIEDDLFYKEITIEEYFSEISSIFEKELNVFYFPSFLKSKFYKDLTEKLKENKNLFEIKKEVYYDFEKRNLDELDITDEDFDIIREIEKESKTWDLLGTFSPTLNVYYSTKQVNFFNKISI